MTQAIAQNINKISRYKEIIFIFLATSIVILTLCYAYFVHGAIVNVVEREKIVKDIREKSTTVSELESTYFKEKDKINIELAHAKGFVDAEVSSYISKKSLTAYVVHNDL